MKVLAELVSIGTLLAFGVVCAGVVKMRQDAPDLPRPYEVQLSPLPIEERTISNVLWPLT